MTITEAIYNKIPVYPDHATAPQIAQILGLKASKVKAVITSMDSTLPVAELGNLFTRIDDRPYVQRYGAKANQGRME